MIRLLFLLLILSGTANALSPSQSPSKSSSYDPVVFTAIEEAPSGATEYLESVVACTVYEVDAGVTASYDSSGAPQEWKNLTLTPADGESQSAYDFYLGNSSGSDGRDPSFNSSGAASTFDIVNDMFTLQGSPTQFLKDMHKTIGGTDFFIAIAFTKVDVTWGSFPMWSTTVNLNSNDGIFTRTTSTGAGEIFQTTEGAGGVVHTSTTRNETAGRHLFIWSYDTSTGQIDHYNDTKTVETDTITFNTNTGENIAGHALAATAGETFFFNEGAFAAVAVGNCDLTQSEADAIFDTWEARHGVDYTP